jgi:hypothetical protein
VEAIMIGFLIGTACLIGLIGTLRGGCGRWGGRGWAGHGCGGHAFGGHGWGGGCHGGWGGRGGHYRGGWGGFDHEEGMGRGLWGGFGRGGFVLRALSERLDATPAQEKVIAEALREVREAFMKHRGELRGSRGDVAKAVRAESFDEVLFGELFARHDAAIEELRKTVMGALAKVHASLEPGQRDELARIIESGPFGFRGRGPRGRYGAWA